jgi:hypothetical protein
MHAKHPINPTSSFRLGEKRKTLILPRCRDLCKLDSRHLRANELRSIPWDDWSRHAVHGATKHAFTYLTRKTPAGQVRKNFSYYSSKAPLAFWPCFQQRQSSSFNFSLLRTIATSKCHSCYSRPSDCPISCIITVETTKLSES